MGYERPHDKCKVCNLALLYKEQKVGICEGCMSTDAGRRIAASAPPLAVVEGEMGPKEGASGGGSASEFAAAADSGGGDDESGPSWRCRICTMDNSFGALACAVCHAPHTEPAGERATAPLASAGVGTGLGFRVGAGASAAMVGGASPGGEGGAPPPAFEETGGSGETGGGETGGGGEADPDFLSGPPHWQCQVCMWHNAGNSEVCESCRRAKGSLTPSPFEKGSVCAQSPPGPPSFEQVLRHVFALAQSQASNFRTFTTEAQKAHS